MSFEILTLEEFIAKAERDLEAEADRLGIPATERAAWREELARQKREDFASFENMDTEEAVAMVREALVGEVAFWKSLGTTVLPLAVTFRAMHSIAERVRVREVWVEHFLKEYPHDDDLRRFAGALKAACELAWRIFHEPGCPAVLGPEEQCACPEKMSEE